MTMQRKTDFDTLKPVSELETFTAFCRNVLERYNGNERVLVEKRKYSARTDILEAGNEN